jgi:hypothetical protein
METKVQETIVDADGHGAWSRAVSDLLLARSNKVRKVLSFLGTWWRGTRIWWAGGGGGIIASADMLLLRHPS